MSLRMPDVTVVYYTSNCDYPKLEDAVRKTIWKNSDGLPIVSVSQKPLDFGNNVCVGPIGRSFKNILMQLRIGAELATTGFVAVCEADTLLPPKFFQFTPPRNDTYYYPQEAYILFSDHRKDFYYSKRMEQTVGVVDREHLLTVMDTLQSYAENDPQNENRLHLESFIATITTTEVTDLGPIVTLKTDRQMHEISPHRRRKRSTTLPVWGTPSEVWTKYA